MDEISYKEKLFEVFYGQPVDIIDPLIRVEVLNQVSDKFQERVYARYIKLHPESGQIDIYWFKKVCSATEAIKDLDYEKLNNMLESMGKIKQELIKEELKKIK